MIDDAGFAFERPNFDIGNGAALGYDPAQKIATPETGGA